jgi:hypothetical protein
VRREGGGRGVGAKNGYNLISPNNNKNIRGQMVREDVFFSVFAVFGKIKRKELIRQHPAALCDRSDLCVSVAAF